jgi:hypothetical protein
VHAGVHGTRSSMSNLQRRRSSSNACTQCGKVQILHAVSLSAHALRTRVHKTTTGLIEPATGPSAHTVGLTAAGTLSDNKRNPQVCSLTAIALKIKPSSRNGVSGVISARWSKLGERGNTTAQTVCRRLLRDQCLPNYRAPLPSLMCEGEEPAAMQDGTLALC